MSERDLAGAEAHADAVESWSQVDVEKMLMGRTGEASRARVELRRKAQQLGQAKAAYKLVRAQTALRFRARDIEDDVPSRGKGAITESIRDARVDADDAVKNAALAFFVAEASFDAEQEAARLLRSEMNSFQSVLADLRPMVSER